MMLIFSSKQKLHLLLKLPRVEDFLLNPHKLSGDLLRNPLLLEVSTADVTLSKRKKQTYNNPISTHGYD